MFVQLDELESKQTDCMCDTVVLVTQCVIVECLVQLTGESGQCAGRAPDLWLKGCEFESWQECRENFLLQSQFSVLTLIQCLVHPMLPQYTVKDPGHSAQSACGRLHLYMHATLTQQSWCGLAMLPRHSVGTHQGNGLTHNSSENTQP